MPRSATAPPDQTVVADDAVLADDVVVADDVVASEVVERRRPAARAVLAGLAVVLAAATVTVLVVELRHADLRTTVSQIRAPYVCLAVAAILVSVVAAAYNLVGFAPLRLRLLPTVMAQLAVSAIRVVAPSVVSTPTIATRYLVRSGASTPDALAAVGIAQTVQFVVTVLLVGGLDITSGWGRLFVGSLRLSLALVAGFALYLLCWLAVRRNARAARLADHARGSLAAVVGHVRRRPGIATAGLVGSAVLTVSHVAAFAFCVWGSGGHASLATLTSVYLVAIAAGSVIPTPGGTGAVEAAMITGLTVAGVALPAATAATVLFRLISVWMLVPPGWIALIALRRRDRL